MRKHKSIGVREIAQRLHLNISTVSRALNCSRQVSRETTELVLKTANEMGYHLSTREKNIIILLPDPSLEWYTMNLLNALSIRLRKHGYFWEFINASCARIIPERSTIGIISLDYLGNAAHQLGQSYNLPIVCINDRSSHFDNVYSVMSDDETAVSLALKLPIRLRTQKNCLCEFQRHYTTGDTPDNRLF